MYIYIYIYTVYNIYTGVCVCFKVETTGVAIEILYTCIKYLGRSISILRQLHLELSRIFNHFWVQFQEFSDSAYYSVLRRTTYVVRRPGRHFYKVRVYTLNDNLMFI
jgi:hypothetical protein